MGAIVSKKKEGQANEGGSTQAAMMNNEQFQNKIWDTKAGDTVEAANFTIAINKGDLSTNIELRFSGQNIPQLDWMSFSDPMLAVYLSKDEEKQPEEGEMFVEQKKLPKWKEQDKQKEKDKQQPHQVDLSKYDFKGISDVILETANPKFLKTFIFPYKSDQQQKVFDNDDLEDVDNLEKQEYIGLVEIDFTQLMNSTGQSLTKPIIDEKKPQKKLGTITVQAKHYNSGGKKFLMNFNLKGFVSKQELFIQISSISENSNWIPIYSSEKVKNQKKKPVPLKQFKLSASQFDVAEEKDLDKGHIQIEVFEYGQKGTTFLGEIETNLKLLTNSKEVIIQNNGYEVGQLKILKANLDVQVSFLNYLVFGSQISILAAFDLTNSNRLQNEKRQKLLNQDEDFQNNEYIEAMQEILPILQSFDHDNKVPLYGFGARLKPYYNIVSHCFAMNGDFFNPNIMGGIEEIVQTYKNSVKNIKLHGPTALAEAIQMGNMYAAAEEIEEDKLQYYIMIIFMDGNIDDIESVYDELVVASQNPITYMIVGIGDEDFSKFQENFEYPSQSGDSSHGTKRVKIFSKYHNKKAIRDNIQFFRYNDFKKEVVEDKLNELKQSTSKIRLDDLAEQCLRKLPHHFLDFYRDIKGQQPPIARQDVFQATQDFMTNKVEDRKKQKNKIKSRQIKDPEPEPWLKAMKEGFISQLYKLGYDKSIVREIIEKQNICCPDINLFIELYSQWNQQEDEEPNQLVSQIQSQENTARLRTESDLNSRSFNDINSGTPIIRSPGLPKLKTHKGIISGNFAKTLKPQLQKFDKIEQVSVEQKGQLIHSHHFVHFTNPLDILINKRQCETLKNTQNFIKSIPIQRIENLEEERELQNEQMQQDQQSQYEKLITMQSENTVISQYSYVGYSSLKDTQCNLCLYCRKLQIQSVFMPCGHAASCFQCLEKIRPSCIICGFEICQIIKVEDIFEESAYYQDIE